MDESLKPEQLWSVFTRAADQAEEAGRLEESVGLLRQAVRMAEIAFGDSHHDYAFSLIRLADGCIDLNRFDDAEEYYQEAIPVLEQSLGETHLSVAISYRNLAELYKRLGKVDEAQLARSKANDIIDLNRAIE